MTTKDSLSLTFGALADPKRRRILSILAKKDMAVTKLAESFSISQPAISKHLKVLEKAGLVSRGRNAQWRPAKLQAEPLKEVSEWTEQYRQHWEESLERLGDYLRSMETDTQGKEGGNPEKT